MHWMRPLSAPAVWGLALGLAILGATTSRADLIRPGAPRAYPDVAADINGTLNYTYDSSTETGVYEQTNTPFLLAVGPTVAEEYAITPATGGFRSQQLRFTLDSSGNLVEDAGNIYSLTGRLVVGDQVFDGELLTGVPSAFGYSDLGSAGIQTSDIFDVEIDVTGGQLAEAFGPDLYMRIVGELNSNFEGSFTADFSADKATSNTRGYNAPDPNPIPEPTVTAILAVAAAGWIYRRHRIGRRADGNA